MKKTALAFVLAALVIASIFPGAYAQETTQEQLDPDVNVMHSETGVKIKFLQLERALNKLLIRGSLVIDYIERAHPDADTQDLERILDEIELLIEEVENIDYNQDLRELINIYLDIKQDARELVQKFKAIVKEIVSSDDRDGIREALDAADYSELDKITEEIKELKREHNAYRVERLLNAAGVEDDELLEQIKNGEITLDEVKKKLRGYAKDLSPEDRKAAKNELKKQRNVRTTVKDAVSDHRKANVLDRKSDRADNRAQILRERSDRAEENGFDWRAKKLDRVAKFQEAHGRLLDKRSDQLREDSRDTFKKVRRVYNNQHDIVRDTAEVSE